MPSSLYIPLQVYQERQRAVLAVLPPAFCLTSLREAAPTTTLSDHLPPASFKTPEPSRAEFSPEVGTVSRHQTLFK